MRWLSAGLLLAASARPGGLLEMELTLSGDTLVRTVSVRTAAEAGETVRRVSRPYDPAWQSVELLEASLSDSSGRWAPLPAWALERVDGSGGYPMSLQLAFTGLNAGDSLRWSIRLREWGPRAEAGPWLVLPPPDGVDSARVCVEPASGTRFRGDGWRGETEDGRLLLTASACCDTLWVSSLESWTALGELIPAGLPRPGDSLLPPDLREAALQAASAGADPYSQLCLARTLLTESFAIDRQPSPPRSWIVRDPQRILDSRRARPLEMAVLLGSICRVLGMQAEVIPATEFRPLLPVPAGWNVYLVRASLGRRSWTVDPSGTLTQADHLEDGRRLWMLRAGADRVVSLGGGGTASLCRERWRLSPKTGRFTLRLYCRGDYDAAVRRRLAGLEGREDEAAMTLWLWQSGASCVADSVSSSDLYRLDAPVEMVVDGRLGQEGDVLLLPGIDWDLDGATGELRRRWRLPGGAAAPRELVSHSGPDSTVLRTDSASVRGDAVLLGE